MTHCKFLDDIHAVIVLYNATLEGSATINSISKFLIHSNRTLDLVVYDNSPTPVYSDESFKFINFNISYIHDRSNPGVSKAYNTAAQVARRRGKKWILLLDQDTEFDNNLLSSFDENIEKHPDINLFTPILKIKNGKIFSPSKYFFKRGFFIKNISPGLHTLKYLSPVNSGMLINLEAFHSVGGYNEKVRLDFSDFQFIERLKTKYDKFFVINSIGVQDFSNEKNNLNQLKARFTSYCNDVLSCSKSSLLDYVAYYITSFGRTLSLTYRTKSLIFIKIWFKFLLLNNHD